MHSNHEASFTLYHKSNCPYCARVFTVINELDVHIQLHNIFREPAKAKELLLHGGKRQVPCLRIGTADGKNEFLYESQDIIHYLRKKAQHAADAA